MWDEVFLAMLDWWFLFFSSVTLFCISWRVGMEGGTMEFCKGERFLLIDTGLGAS